MKRIVYIITAVAVIIGFSGAVQAQVSNDALLFLRINASPVGNGMGRCSVTEINGYSAIYNPGAAGIMALDRNIYLTLPIKDQWLPNISSKLYLSIFSAGIGINNRLLTGNNTGRFNYALGISYSRFKLEYDNMIRTDDLGDIIAIYDGYDGADLYTFSAGVEYYFRIGAGISFKRIKSDLGAFRVGRVNSSDYGFYVDLPLHSLWRGDRRESPDNRFHFELTPAFAYAVFNTENAKITYENVAGADPLPYFKRSGYAINGALTRGDLEFISARYSHEIDENKRNSSDRETMNGYEIGLFDLAFIRFGDFKNDYGELDENTFGFGVNLGRQVIGEFTSPESILRNFEVEFDYSQINDNPNSPLSNTSFYGLSLSYSL